MTFGSESNIFMFPMSLPIACITEKDQLKTVPLSPTCIHCLENMVTNTSSSMQMRKQCRVAQHTLKTPRNAYFSQIWSVWEILLQLPQFYILQLNMTLITTKTNTEWNSAYQRNSKLDTSAQYQHRTSKLFSTQPDHYWGCWCSGSTKFWSEIEGNYGSMRLNLWC